MKRYRLSTNPIMLIKVMVRHHQCCISASRCAGTLWQQITTAFCTGTTQLNNVNKTRKICWPSANILC